MRRALETTFGLLLLVALLVGLSAALVVQGARKALQSTNAKKLLPALAVTAVLALSLLAPSPVQVGLAKCHGYGYAYAHGNC